VAQGCEFIKKNEADPNSKELKTDLWFNGGNKKSSHRAAGSMGKNGLEENYKVFGGRSFRDLSHTQESRADLAKQVKVYKKRGEPGGI